MLRLLLTPVVLIALCITLPTLWFLQAVLIYGAFDAAAGGHSPLRREDVAAGVTLMFNSLGFWNLGFGICLAVAVAVWDTFKNGPTDRSGLQTARRLVGNLMWCGFYTEIAIVLDALAVILLRLVGHVVAPGFNDYLLAIPIYGTFGIGLVGFLWAVFRSVNALDVLKPRVLAAKLRRSTRLQN